MGTREKILNNIADTLLSIKKQNGYSNNVKTVSRNIEEWLSAKEHMRQDSIVLFISWHNDTKETTGANQQSVISLLHTFIRGIIVSTAANIETDANSLCDDIEKAMAVDITRGGNAIYTIPVTITTYHDPAASNILIFDYEFYINYVYNFGNP